jgi:GT2 family glycosyltransferase
MPVQPLAYVVVLNYNGLLDTIACLESLARVTYRRHRLVIVDNGSSDGSGNALARRYPWHDFIQNERNLGFAGGYNVGIKLGLEQGADYVCILNNDTAVSSGFLEPLVGALEKDGSIGIAGPVVCEHDRPDIVQTAGAKANLYLGKFYGLHAGEHRSEIGGITDVDYISGACMLFRCSLAMDIGYIPEDYFLFFEETEWCLKARKSGFRVVCVGDSVIWHKGSSSTKNVPGAIAYFMARNQIIFEKKNASRLQWATFVVTRIIVFCLGLVRRWASGTLNRDMIKGVRDGLAYRGRTDGGISGP